MNFQHYSLNHRHKGDVVEISLQGNAANIRVMDDINFHRYKSRQRYQYLGGLATKSLTRIQIPNEGNWHVAVDLEGYRGNVRSSVRVL
ncbi:MULTISPECIES: DUF1883 domain-containing protein [Enterobacterales]|jgi:hypothetical protein|uniref:DUF1883 domain-containing protein n=1 Tax=Enterobacterales TaxID=91347 RepID=UPI00124C7E49|nr:MULTISPECIES: DUF1883 domain-containing protein [Enterobacterales]EKN5090071.1 DUF1883 domain-containing protein [Yersinia enterocolitica]EKV3580540.1 DUF1883 domain-containing protein [Enterobacter ludwigii]MBD0902127.1 DUF1883 domain-containing protein [Klebsiella grimontii]QMR74186.1 DUF1883 domain-containing protein [Enterobacter sp. RHBSTW-00175]CAI1006833.1 Domain of uncharacterised function (DUF1883) [Serratia quinivorans]